MSTTHQGRLYHASERFDRLKGLESLPHEILGLVIAYATECTNEPTRVLAASLLVSKAWCNAALTTPRVWRRIHFVRPYACELNGIEPSNRLDIVPPPSKRRTGLQSIAHASEFFERSGACSKYVLLDGIVSEDEVLQLKQLLKRHVALIVDLEVRLFKLVRRTYHAVGQHVVDGEYALPVLQTFRLPDCVDWAAKMPIMQRLQHLQLSATQFTFLDETGRLPLSLTRCIKTLRLHGRSIYSRAVLSIALNHDRFLNLTSLFAVSSYIPPDRFTRHSHLRLTTLSLHLCTFRPFALISLYTPALKSFALSLDYGSTVSLKKKARKEVGSALLEFIKRSLPLIRELWMDHVIMEDKTFASLLSLLPYIEVLALSGVSLSDTFIRALSVLEKTKPKANAGRGWPVLCPNLTHFSYFSCSGSDSGDVSVAAVEKLARCRLASHEGAIAREDQLGARPAKLLDLRLEGARLAHVDLQRHCTWDPVDEEFYVPSDRCGKPMLYSRGWERWAFPFDFA